MWILLQRKSHLESQRSVLIVPCIPFFVVADVGPPTTRGVKMTGFELCLRKEVALNHFITQHHSGESRGFLDERRLSTSAVHEKCRDVRTNNGPCDAKTNR